MNSYQNPVTPPDPYDRYRIEAAGGQKERQSGGGGEPPKEKASLAAYVLNLLHRLFSLFLEAPEGAKPAEKEIIETLRSLKASFEILKREDRSEDIQFLNHLSQLWQHLLEDSLHFQRDTPIAGQFKALVKKIQHYPQHQTHTLGYYLSEYAGQKWIPFPYMEMIQQIHSEHEKSPSSSPLTEWTTLIDDLLPRLS